MNKLLFRDLYADEIELRVGSAKDNGFSLLLYKDARCDQNILDDTVGPLKWQRHHSRDNANCIVSIWDEEKNQWIGKEDTGTESNTEKEKGLASDSFKRACVNWGIGRELYTAPFIWIPAAKCSEYTCDRGRWGTKDTFVVDEIAIENKHIVMISIYNEKTNQVVFSWKKAGYVGKKQPKVDGIPAYTGKKPPESTMKVEMIPAKDAPVVRFDPSAALKNWCKRNKVSMDEFGKLRQMAIDGGHVEDVPSAKLSVEQFDQLIRGVEKVMGL